MRTRGLPGRVIGTQHEPRKAVFLATILPAKPNAVEGSFEPVATWRQSMKNAIRDGRELCRLLEIPLDTANQSAELDFPVFAPLEYVARMQRGNESDPLLRQVVATGDEKLTTGFRDPVGDLDSIRVPGLLQKYAGRVLLIASGACAVHCRYCFRRHFPYATGQAESQKWRAWLDVIRNDSSVDEVILSGGDPLSVADEVLAWFVHELDHIPHVKRLRIHTRLPVVIPGRITPELLEWVGKSRLAVYCVLHVNHAQEIDAAVIAAANRLRQAGATLMNQAVLLAGVNDSAACQIQLCRALVDLQIIPYYLHQLDPVQGALHFSVSDERALDIVERMRDNLPGYAVPALVREIAGRTSKSAVTR